jgi:hypothetical protein
MASSISLAHPIPLTRVLRSESWASSKTALSLLSKLGSLLFGTGYPSPVSLQNPENKGSILRLCARSLSLQELRAKSGEHWSYGGREVPFWNRTDSLERGSPRSRVVTRVKLSKIEDYLADNVSCSSLSDSKYMVDDKRRVLLTLSFYFRGCTLKIGMK